MEGGGPRYLNLEYFFRLLYESRPSLPDTPSGSFSWNVLVEWFIHFWSTFAAVAFVFSLAALGVLIYASVRMFQVKQHLHHKIGKLDIEEAEHAKDHSRWAHIQSLIESPQARDWREAIMEADIMLEDALAERGYEGESVGDRLKNAKFGTLDQAWEAHKVRNRVAHEGIAFELTDRLAYRTVKQYELVFKEFGEI
jgi:hypothetical protein